LAPLDQQPRALGCVAGEDDVSFGVPAPSCERDNVVNRHCASSAAVGAPVAEPAEDALPVPINESARICAFLSSPAARLVLAMRR
jgi:hypothetical protein